MPGKHHLRGFKIATTKIGSPLRGSWTPHRRWVKPPPPPWKKARSAPGQYDPVSDYSYDDEITSDTDSLTPDGPSRSFIDNEESYELEMDEQGHE